MCASEVSRNNVLNFRVRPILFCISRQRQYFDEASDMQNLKASINSRCTISQEPVFFFSVGKPTSDRRPQGIGQSLCCIT